MSDLLGGSNDVFLGHLINDQLLKSRDWPFAAALSVVMMLLTSLFLWLYRRAGGKAEEHCGVVRGWVREKEWLALFPLLGAGVDFDVSAHHRYGGVFFQCQYESLYLSVYRLFLQHYKALLADTNGLLDALWQSLQLALYSCLIWRCWARWARWAWRGASSVLRARWKGWRFCLP